MSEFFGLDQVTDVSQLKVGNMIYQVRALGEYSDIRCIKLKPHDIRLNAPWLLSNGPDKLFFTLDSAFAYQDNCKILRINRIKWQNFYDFNSTHDDQIDYINFLDLLH